MFPETDRQTQRLCGCKSIYCLYGAVCPLQAVVCHSPPHPPPPIVFEAHSTHNYIYFFLTTNVWLSSLSQFFSSHVRCFLWGKTLKVLEKCKFEADVASEPRLRRSFLFFPCCALWILIFFFFIIFFLPCVTCSELYCMR